ncbi:MAG: antitoxin [Thermomonas sp.]|uniref:type II toxin-antitoxin system RelB family antitoxin n=1 Tax=Thermomonas sp. TaxID=1971895 RepID=UPI0039E499FD
MTEKKLDPRVSEFETEEQAESYDRWFRAKVQAAMKSDRPRVPHDEAIARVRATIAQVAANRKKSA